MAARATEMPTLINMFLPFIASPSFIEFYRSLARASSRSFDSNVDLNRTAVTLLGNGGAGYHVILLGAITRCWSLAFVSHPVFLLDALRARRIRCLQSRAMDKMRSQNARRFAVLMTFF